MNIREEAEKVTANLDGDHRKIADYLIQRCGEFIYDHQRADLIAEFLRAAGLHGKIATREDVKDVYGEGVQVGIELGKSFKC